MQLTAIPDVVERRGSSPGSVACVEGRERLSPARQTRMLQTIDR